MAKGKKLGFKKPHKVERQPPPNVPGKAPPPKALKKK